MKCKAEDNNTKNKSENDNKNQIKMSPNKNNDKKKALRDINTQKDEFENKIVKNKTGVSKKKSENEDNKNKIKTSSKNNDKKEALKNTDKDEFKDKDNKNKMEISESENNDEEEFSKNMNTQKNEKTKDTIETLKNKDSDDKKAPNTMNTKKNKKKKGTIETSESKDNDEESENINICKVKFALEDTKNEVETSESENNDLSMKCKIYKYKNTYKKESDSDINESDTNEMETSGDEDIVVKRDINKVTYESNDENGEEYCSDATYLARQMESSEKLTERDSLKLHKLYVQLRHTVPPQHKIETRAGSHMPMREEIEKFEKIVPIRRGVYSGKEDDIIVANWKAFCKLHDWDVKKLKPFLQLRVGNLTYMRNAAERRKFVQFLADGLPNRTLYSVYHRFRNLYGNNVQRRYRPDEDEMIIDHLENNPGLEEKRKYVDLAKALKRTRHSIWRRYKILKKKNKKRKETLL